VNVRVRYAPSPTGLQHVGSVRTALFNYLFARATGGVFILRIEDTDRERLRADAMQDIYDTFAWLGVSWDEGPDKGGPFGPYVQSERREIYRRKADELLANGTAYKCFCTSERLERLREEQAARKAERTGYDRHCRNLSTAEVAALEAQGARCVVRLKVPTEGTTSYHDQLLGDITVPNQDINPDPVLLKSDGYPTYHLANVVDDHLMEITHILRAQEWLASVPLHVQLYKAFGWEPPIYCHLPMVLGPDGHKLSKRHGATSVIDFRNQGYLPEAMLNYIALVGWAYDDSTEFFSREDLEKVFALEKLNKAPAVFDYQKLAYFNGAYIRKKTDAELADALMPGLEREGLVSTPGDRDTVRMAMPLVRERLKLLSEAPALMRFLFKEPEASALPVADMVPKKSSATAAVEALETFKNAFADISRLPEPEQEARVRELAAAKGMKVGDFLMPVRVAITGSKVSPPLLASAALLGAARVGARIDAAIKILRG
jgi:glutamyl-tRNA synthetase